MVSIDTLVSNLASTFQVGYFGSGPLAVNVLRSLVPQLLGADSGVCRIAISGDYA